MKRAMVVLFAIGFFACNLNYEQTPSGLPYKIFRGKGGDKPKAGQFLKFDLEYRLADRDSALQSTFGRLPVYSGLDTGKRVQYTFMEIMPLMSVGDSAVVSISIDSLKSKGMIQDYSPIFVKGQVLFAKLKLLRIFKDEKATVEDFESSREQEKASEIKSLEAYMATNNLKGTKTKNGAFVVVENPGDQTNKADSGKVATIMYRGYLTTNGKVFDTNMDTTRGHTDPLQIPVGSGNAIPGFSEGLPYFGKGGKGKILIPAMLGYGQQSPGPDIPAFSNLVFDIEVTDVKDAPPAQENPMLQQQLMQQLQRQQQQKDSTHNH